MTKEAKLYRSTSGAIVIKYTFIKAGEKNPTIQRHIQKSTIVAKDNLQKAKNRGYFIIDKLNK